LQHICFKQISGTRKTILYMKSYSKITQTLFLLLLLIAGCKEKTEKDAHFVVYDTSIDTIRCDRWELGLHGKVKTMDVYYYMPASKLSLSKPKFKRGELWDYNSYSHIHILFNEEGFKEKELFLNSTGDTIRHTIRTYNENGYREQYGSVRLNGRFMIDLYVYDKAGRLLEDSDRFYEYDEHGNLIRDEWKLRDNCSNCLERYTYDTDGKCIEMQKYDYNDEVTQYGVYTYSNNGKRLNIREYEIEYTGGSRLKKHTIQDFDSRGNLVKEEIHYIDRDAPEGTEYDDDPYVYKYRYEYDNDRIIKKLDGYGNILEEYDKEGRLIGPDLIPGLDFAGKNLGRYTYDAYKNWTGEKEFVYYKRMSGYPRGGSFIVRNGMLTKVDNNTVEITRPWIEREFTYYE